MAGLEGSIFGLGNPLLDIVIDAQDADFTQWGVAPGATSLANDAQKPLYPDLLTRPGVSFVAGGAAQNTIRGAQWLLQVPGAASYTGSVGKDATAKVLNDTASAAGVKTMYYETDKDATGCCAVLVQSAERALIANIAAANHFAVTHLETEAVKAAVEKARVFYATGFFLTLPEGPAALIKIGQHAKEHNKTFVFNLGAPFIVDFFWDQLQSVLPYADFVICNEHEASAYAKKVGCEGDRHTAATKLAALPKENANRPRTVIFTQGPEATIVFSEGKIREFKPTKLESDKIVDLNGAGDAFAAGIVSGLAKGASLEVSIDAGHNAACHVIQRSGPVYPEKPDFVWTN
jgi:adenosine kinase